MARPDYNRGSLMIVHISPRSYTLPQLFFFYTDISHTLFNFNVSLQFNRRIFHRYSCCLFHLRSFLFSFFFYILSVCSVSQVQGRAHRTLCGKTNWKYLAPRNIYIYRQRFDSNIYVYILYVCVCRRGDNGISGRAGSLLNIRPLGAPAS